MNVLIVEDESLSRQRLIEMLSHCDQDLHILDQTDSIEDTVAFVRSNPPLDIAFFDIRLSDGLSFEIFNQTEINFPVIFTTAYDDYALRAFKVNSIDYLLKPINYEELNKALVKFQRYYINSREKLLPVSQEDISKFIRSFQSNYKKRFIVKFGDHIQFKNAHDIACFFADGKTVYLVTQNSNRKYITDHTLEELEHNLLDPESFFRINRKYIVRIDAIQDVRYHINSRLKLKLNATHEGEIVVSRDKVSDFKAWLNQ